MDYEWAMLWLTRLIVGVSRSTLISAFLHSHFHRSSSHQDVVLHPRHSSCRSWLAVQGGGIGAVALAVLYTFQERLASVSQDTKTLHVHERISCTLRPVALTCMWSCRYTFQRYLAFQPLMSTHPLTSTLSTRYTPIPPHPCSLVCARMPACNRSNIQDLDMPL